MEEKTEQILDNPPGGEKTAEGFSGGKKVKEVDLNSLFPGKRYNLNRLFPDEATRRLLYQVKRNKIDIERFIENLHFTEEE